MEEHEIDLPWFPFWAADFTDSRTVRNMTPEQVGVYVLLLCDQWKEGSVPDDPEEWRGITNHADENTVRTVLERCFNDVPQGWVNERLEQVRTEQIEKRMQKVRAGKASGRARRKRSKFKRSNNNEQRSNSVATEVERKSNESESESDTDTTPPPTAREEDENGFSDLLPDAPHAVEALAGLGHKGGVRGTVATLRTRFLYTDDGAANPDPSVSGKVLGERRELVAGAIMEMQDQGIREWSARALAGFIRRLDRGGNGAGTNDAGIGGESGASEGESPFGDPSRYHFGREAAS